MQYFVSVENSSYFYWQLEILIESFLMQGLENKLVIGFAENESQKLKGLSSNIVKYGKKFILNNDGRKLDYLPINRINSIRYAMAYKILEFPFVMIHSDMILKKPIEISEDDEKYGLIVNNFESPPQEETNLVKKEVDSRIKEDGNKIPFFSSPVVFNKSIEYCADAFFAKVQAYENSLIKEKGVDFPCERTAWEIAIAEGHKHFGIKGKFMSAPMMYETDGFNFIHYKSGIPPVFHKKYFKYENEVVPVVSPYDIILEHNPTANTDYVHSVIKSYKKRNFK